MPIKRLLAGSELGPEEVEILTAAFNRALRSLGVVDRNDPLTELIARKIIEIGATGTAFLIIEREKWLSLSKTQRSRFAR